MNRRSVMDEIRLPNHDEPASAVTILDSQGRVMRVVPANEFRRGPVIRRHPIVGSRRSGGSTFGQSPAAAAAPVR
ncbi:MAG TPA: hypothetical protein VK201_03420 [bacterium]|nr:hypothetical protein [bacterium]